MIALFCTSCIFSSVVLGADKRAITPYSRTGLTYCLYNCMIILGLHPQLVPLRSLSKFNRLIALDIAIFICDRKLNVFVIVTPSSASST